MGQGMMMKRRSIITVALVLVVVMVATVAYVVCDVRFHGPQVVRFNHRCDQIVREHGLIGQSRTAVEKALGKPTSVFTYDKPGSFTLNYSPHPSFPFANFQAHFKDDKLSNTELFDD